MRGRTLIITILTLVFCGIVAVAFWRREPVYKGRTLSGWVLDVKSSSYLSPEAREAVRAAGTNGIPVYLGWLRYKRSRLTEAKRSIAMRCNRWLGLQWNTDDPLQRGAYGAQLAFDVLGENGQAAIPGLLRHIIGSPSREAFMPAMKCLGSIGRPAVPALISLTTNDNSEIREWSTGTLARQWKDERVIPHLTLLLNHSSHSTRVVATNCLDYIEAVSRRSFHHGP